jgi:hypothetical protein
LPTIERYFLIWELEKVLQGPTAHHSGTFVEGVQIRFQATLSVLNEILRVIPCEERARRQRLEPAPLVRLEVPL